jgi:hypothetical protein
MTHKNTKQIGSALTVRIPKRNMSDIRHKISSEHFEIDHALNKFSIAKSKLKALIKSDILWPWPQGAKIEQGETDLGQHYPKISLISSDTGKDATFFLASATNTQLIFKPSKGTIMKKHPQLRGWIIRVDLSK